MKITLHRCKEEAEKVNDLVLVLEPKDHEYCHRNNAAEFELLCIVVATDF